VCPSTIVYRKAVSYAWRGQTVEQMLGLCGTRGDVGSWLRMAAADSLTVVIQLAARLLPEEVVQPLLLAAVAALLKQSVERISAVRKVRCTRKLPKACYRAKCTVTTSNAKLCQYVRHC
jgi:hypothetical protein